MLKLWLEKIATKQSSVFLGGLLGFIIGVAAAEVLTPSAFWLFCLFLGAVLGGVFFWPQKAVRPILISAVFLFLGAWRLAVSLPDFQDQGKIYFYREQEVEFYGTVKKVERRIEQQKITVRATALVSGQKIDGLVLVSTRLYPEYAAGWRLKISCRLRQPAKTGDFDYERYLSRYNVHVICFAGAMEKMAENPAQFLSLLARWKKIVSDRIFLTVKEPEASVLAAMVLGDQWKIPRHILDEFATAGLSHLIAISGMNIAIIAQILTVFLISIGLNRRRTFWPVACFLIFYLGLISFPASAARAVIMALIFLYAQKIGRSKNVLVALVFAAVLMLAWSPRILLADIGFQLSFSAILGLMYLAPALERLAARGPNFWGLKSMIVATLAAQIMTGPLIVFHFHRLSLIALLANVLVLPLASFLTVWGIVNTVVSLISVVLGKMLGLISWFFIGYIIMVARDLSLIPLAQLSLPKLNIFILAGLYGLIGWWAYRERKNREYKAESVTGNL